LLEKSDSFYYSPPPTSFDGFLTVFLIVLLVAGVAAIYWFSPTKKNDEKTVREEIDKIFKELKECAVQFKRDEALGALDTAKDKVTAVLGKKGYLDKT